MDNVYVYRIPLPGKVKGLTVLKNGDYIVFINENLCEETQNIALQHELRHIKYNHLYNDCINVPICECQANIR